MILYTTRQEHSGIIMLSAVERLYISTSALKSKEKMPHIMVYLKSGEEIEVYRNNDISEVQKVFDGIVEFIKVRMMSEDVIIYDIS